MTTKRTKYQIRRLVQFTINGAGLVSNKTCYGKDIQYLISFAKQIKDTNVDKVVVTAITLRTLGRERITDYLWKEEKNNGRYTTKTS